MGIVSSPLGSFTGLAGRKQLVFRSGFVKARSRIPPLGALLALARAERQKR
jgi:hypothetical protein